MVLKACGSQFNLDMQVTEKTSLAHTESKQQIHSNRAKCQVVVSQSTHICMQTNLLHVPQGA